MSVIARVHGSMKMITSVCLPLELYMEAKEHKINVSGIAQAALREEIDRLKDKHLRKQAKRLKKGGRA